jgi:queuine tRNA-ribosyltransferase
MNDKALAHHSPEKSKLVKRSPVLFSPLFPGFHKMIGWKKPILTDSGGFHIFSLGCGCGADEVKGERSFNGARRKTLLKIVEESTSSRSYVDGNLHCISPEISIQIQRKPGDRILPFNECTPFHSTRGCTANSIDGGHRWEVRTLQEFRKLSDGT